MNFSTKRRPSQLPNLTINGGVMSQVSKHKHLGVFLTETMSWKEHIDHIVAKSSKRLGPLTMLKNQVTRTALNTMYITLIRPILEYSSSTFLNLTQADADRLEQVQYKAARIVSGALSGTSRTSTIQEVGWDTLTDRRKSQQATIMYKISNALAPNYLQNALANITRTQGRYNLRNQSLELAVTRTSRYQKSFVPSSISLWNSLPLDIKNSRSLDSFKITYKRTFRTTPKRIFSHGPKRSSRFLAQCRMGFPPLNAYLYIRQLVASPRCACNEGDETTKHFFLKCPKYAAAREELFREVNVILESFDFRLGGINDTLHILLFGHAEISEDCNIRLFDLVFTFITNSNRIARY